MRLIDAIELVEKTEPHDMENEELSEFLLAGLLVCFFSFGAAPREGPEYMPNAIKKLQRGIKHFTLKQPHLESGCIAVTIVDTALAFVSRMEGTPDNHLVLLAMAKLTLLLDENREEASWSLIKAAAVDARERELYLYE